MKKALALIITVLMLFLTGCAGGKEESSQPRLAADVQREKAAASAAAEEEANKSIDTLRVVTDLDCLNNLYGDTSQASNGKKTFDTIIKYFGGTPSGIKAVLDVLPMEGDSAYDAELTKLRTEIMAGKGPDVFLMSGFGGGSGWLPKNTLFQNPESAMEKGLFLPLDEYIENAQFMEFDKFDTDVMAVGRNEQGQVILPMFYRINEMVYFPETDSTQAPADWTEILANEETDIRVRAGFSFITTGFREMCLDQIADNQSEELTITDEEFFQRTKEALDFYRDALPDMTQFSQMMTLQQAASLANSGKMCYCVPGTATGGINASIETWCAVSNTTKHPEDAFFIVDLLLSEDFLRQEAFWNKRPTGIYDHKQMTFFWLAGEDLVPVHTGLLTSAKGTYKYDEGLIASERSAVKEARENISYAYFTSNVDREVDGMFRELMEMVENGETIDDDALRRTTDKTYTTLKMMLAES